MSRKWKVICLGLFVTNIVTLQWLLHVDDERYRAEEWLSSYKQGEGLREAEQDFRAGRTRVYEMEVVPHPAIGQPMHPLTNEFTGRKDGSLEIWAWRCYQPQQEIMLRIWQQQLDGYNGRMTHLYRKYFLQAATNARPAGAFPMAAPPRVR